MGKPRIVVLGAGFGGLELTTLLSEQLGDSIDVTLIDKSDSFMFGFSKLDVMFGHAEADAVRMPYSNYAKPGVKLLKRTITAIDPVARRVTTDDGVFDADYLVVALGAEYDFDATPGLAGTNEFYSIPGAIALRDVLPKFTSGHALIGVCGAPYKCPPAPSECALMLHDYLVQRGVRDNCQISLVLPLSSTTGGTRCLGTPRNRSNGISRPSSSTATLRPLSTEATRRLAMNSIPRSAKASSRARDVSGEGGTGLDSGRTSEIWQLSRTPRWTR